MFILVVVVIGLVTGYIGYSRNSEYDWVIANTEESRNLDAVADAVDQVDLVTTIGTRQETYDTNMFFLFDLKKNEDLYQPRFLQSICLVESKIALDDKYPKFCRLDDWGECTVPETSISVYFYDFTTIESWNCTLLDQNIVEEKRNVLYDAMSTPEGREQYGLWLGAEAPQLGYTTRCNSLWSFGAPLDGYNSTSDEEIEQVRL